MYFMYNHMWKPLLRTIQGRPLGLGQFVPYCILGLFVQGLLGYSVWFTLIVPHQRWQNVLEFPLHVHVIAKMFYRTLP